jgi:tryptophan-rich sensory protein
MHLRALLLLVVITAAAASIGAVASITAPDFYRQLVRPAWAPPPTVFGPVWTVLYALMAAGAWLVVRGAGWPGARPAIALYVVQLAFNSLWTWIFFRWRMGGAAFAEILVLWVLVACTIRVFWTVRPLAGALLVPYLAWVTFATALTWAVWRRNPTLL